MTARELGADVQAAIASSNLRGLPAETINRLGEGARRSRIAARSTVWHRASDEPHLDLVLSGLLRVYVASSEDRTMTVRYCRPGALLGVATIYTETRRSFAIQALADSELLAFRVPVVRRLADGDPRLAGALLVEVSERVMSFLADLSGQAFANVAQRSARHLLDLASDQPGDDLLVAPISQQELAEAIGSVREVVVRVLRDFRERGAVESSRDGIVITDPALLATIQARAWNESS